METEDKEEAEAQSEDDLTEQINTRTERREKRTTTKKQADPPVDPEQESVGNAKKKPIILHYPAPARRSRAMTPPTTGPGKTLAAGEPAKAGQEQT